MDRAREREQQSCRRSTFLLFTLYQSHAICHSKTQAERIIDYIGLQSIYTSSFVPLVKFCRLHSHDLPIKSNSRPATSTQTLGLDPEAHLQFQLPKELKSCIYRVTGNFYVTVLIFRGIHFGITLYLYLK